MVSIIIPMYNSENTIIPCINSVLNQTYKGEIEIIVINDGSTDTSKLKVEQLINDNPAKSNIKLLTKENGGVSSARNCGIKIAQNDFIALLDSDDEWLPQKLDNQLKIFTEDNNIDFVGGLIKNSLKNKRRLKYITLKNLIFKNYFQPSTIVFKKNIINKVGLFDESQKYAEEGNYFIRIAKNHTCILLNEKVVNYGQGKSGFGYSGLSSNLKEMEKGELKNINYAFKKKYINILTYIIAISYSILKYFRRILIVKFRRLC